MKTYDYYYSAKFEGEFLWFHGYFSTAWTELEKIKAKAREHLSEKMKEWGFDGSQLEKFEIYTYRDNDVLILFTWEKERKDNKNNNENNNEKNNESNFNE